MTAIEAIRELIALGVLEIREAGEIWKLARMDSHGHITPSAPRRCEVRLKSGYWGIKVERRGRTYLALSHRVIWTVLRGPIAPGMTINHLNGVKSDNELANLELVTMGANHRHAYRTGLRNRPSNMPAPIAPEILERAKELRAQGRSFGSIAKELGISLTKVFNTTRSVSAPS